MKTSSLKAQDVMLLLKLIAKGKDTVWRQVDLAHELSISQSEVNQSLKRLLKSRLINSDQRVHSAAAAEFLIHGFKYVFPAELGPSTRGIPTAHSAPVMQKHVRSNENYVWPHREGKVLGQAISPLYSSVPNVVLKDKKFYDLLSLLDVVRVGRTREVVRALKYLEGMIKL